MAYRSIRFPEMLLKFIRALRKCHSGARGARREASPLGRCSGEAALAADSAVSVVDRGELGVGDVDELLGHALGNHEVANSFARFKLIFEWLVVQIVFPRCR